LASPVSRHSITGSQIQELWKRHARRYEGSLGRIQDSRELLIGEKKAPLPHQIATLPDGEAFRVDTPEKYTSVLQMRNKMSDPAPKVKRTKTATSDRAEGMASRIERFVNPALEDHLSAQDLADLLVCEAEAAAIVVPNPAAWKKVPSAYYEADGKTIQRAYRRNSKGQDEDEHTEEQEQAPERERKRFRPAERASRAVYDAHERHQRACNPPWEVRLLSRLQCVPINPRIVGKRVLVDGLLVRTRFERSELIREEYIWEGMEDHLEPKDETEGIDGELWLYEAWLVDKVKDAQTGEVVEHPYVAYSVAGKPTQSTKDGVGADAVIDLYEQCGLRSLPVVYGYGWRWASSDPDKRSIPYPFPFGRSWLAKDALLTGKIYAAWSEGMLAWFLQMPPEFAKDPALAQAWTEFVKTNPLTIKPFTILPVMGLPIPAIHPGTGKDVNETLAALSGEVRQDLVNPLARGGGDSASAIERSVVAADTLAGVSDIRRSMLWFFQRVGELILEISCGVARETKKPVLLIGNPQTPNQRGPDQSATRAVIELKPDWLGPEGQESFDLEAYWPRSLEQNLAQNQQFFGFWKDGGITFEMWCELIGVEDPERFRAQLIFDRWIMSEDGMKLAMKDAAEYLGDQEAASLFEMQEQQAAGPGGEPVGMLAGLMQPGAPPPPGGVMPGGPAPVGTQMGSPAVSQLAAISAAGRNTDPAQVTAQPMPPMGM
jgi:hypothetical protein